MTKNLLVFQVCIITIATANRVIRQVFDIICSRVVGLQIAILTLQLHAAFTQIAWSQGRIPVRSDIPVIRERDFKAAFGGCAYSRCKQSTFTLVNEGEVNPGRVKNGYSFEYDAGVPCSG